MGQAKRRGTYEERKAEALMHGRNKPKNGLNKRARRRLAVQTFIHRIIRGK